MKGSTDCIEQTVRINDQGSTDCITRDVVDGF